MWKLAGAKLAFCNLGRGKDRVSQQVICKVFNLSQLFCPILSPGRLIRFFASRRFAWGSFNLILCLLLLPHTLPSASHFQALFVFLRRIFANLTFQRKVLSAFLCPYLSQLDSVPQSVQIMFLPFLLVLLPFNLLLLPYPAAAAAVLPRIVGGEEVPQHSLPFVVSLQVRRGNFLDL